MNERHDPQPRDDDWSNALPYQDEDKHMKLNEMLESKYLKQEDVTDEVVVTVQGLKKVNMARDDDPPEYKWTIKFHEFDKPMVLNATNIKRIAKALGDDTDDWIGNAVPLYVDPDIEYAGKVTGGVRLKGIPRKGTNGGKPKTEAQINAELDDAVDRDSEIPLFFMSDLFSNDIVAQARNLFELLKLCDLPAKVEAINAIRLALHEHSPFATEPVDCVQWVPLELVQANDYNPNTVAPPEMRLLEHSIGEDGYTQPIVAWARDGIFEVVDGFHRNRVGRESKTVRERVHGYLPLSVINPAREDKGDRIASTIRHNRARGKHRVEAMSDIVIELKRRNWSDEKIAKNLGMDPDEILRLTQITGLAEMFKDQDFSQSWEIGEVTEEQIVLDERSVKRIYHTWNKWECYPAGFYESRPQSDLTPKECEAAYRELLQDSVLFEAALFSVITEWKCSCEHYLSNEKMNRIAWLGQAALCMAKGIPACFRGGFNLLTEQEQLEANMLALKYLNQWLIRRGESSVTLEDAGVNAQVNLY